MKWMLLRPFSNVSVLSLRMILLIIINISLVIISNYLVKSALFGLICVVGSHHELLNLHLTVNELGAIGDH